MGLRYANNNEGGTSKTEALLFILYVLSKSITFFGGEDVGDNLQSRK